MHSHIKTTYWKHWCCSLLVTAIAGLLFLNKNFLVKNGIALQFIDNPQLLCQAIQPLGITFSNNLYLDFLFILCYSALFYFSIRVAAELLELKPGKWMAICLLPALCDAIENCYLLYAANCCSSCKNYWILFYAARIKWALVLPFIFLAVIILVYQIFVRLDKLYAEKEK